MSFLKLVSRRRSTRAYLPRPVERPVLERCLEAARLAPSACNSQPWRFLVVDQESMRSKLAAAAFGGMYKMNRFACEAPVLVVIVREKSRYVARMGGLFRGLQYALIDIGIAVEHFVLQAEEEGVGTCWLGWFNERAVKRLLGLSRSDRVDIIISMGYPGEKAKKDSNRKSLDEIREYIYR